MNNVGRHMRARHLPVVGVLAILVAVPIAARAQFRGGIIRKNCENALSPVIPTVKPGDVVLCSLTFQNKDDFGSPIRVDALKDCVLHGDGASCPDFPAPAVCSNPDPTMIPVCSSTAALSPCQTPDLLFLGDNT